jgi:hypothetical protein
LESLSSGIPDPRAPLRCSPGSRLAAILLALILVPPAIAEGPRLSWSPKGCLVLSELPPVLDHNEVGDQLRTGLTTVFSLRVEVQPVDEPMMATLQIRYDLWDEQYLVTLEREPTVVEPLVLSDRSELRIWWSNLRLLFCETNPLSDRLHQAAVSLHVIPFSHSEEAETRQWFTDSVRRAGRDVSDPRQNPVDVHGALDRVFETLIATSIRSRPLVHWNWTLEIDDATEPER